ncbi:right-handed parallel beta-helix repeat-containing protein [Bernardetia sp. ABR2-2B]|uniref:right-handed parallel beta-helix repeat-containing protein n=1 Tax=Bernardetia sp. ABR2-2B TaxID=3127472 RepID=UPI0030CF6DCF
MNTQYSIKFFLIAFIILFSGQSIAQVAPNQDKKLKKGAVISQTAQKPKIVTVTTTQQFLDAIASNTTIQLKGHSFYISDVANPNNSSENYNFREVYDGYELLIHDVKNFKIIGLGKNPVRLYTKPDYGNVIAFNNCDNVTIENVDAGHGASKGSCVGGVFKIENTKNFYIKNTIMYGSGIEGITTDNVTNLVCTNSFIRSCTYSIMTLTGSKNIRFENCVFEDNKEYDLVNITSCSNVSFKNCFFEKNRTSESTSYSDYSVFKVTESSKIALEGCFVEANAADYLCNDEKSLILKNTEVNHNDFTKGKFKK